MLASGVVGTTFSPAVSVAPELRKRSYFAVAAVHAVIQNCKTALCYNSDEKDVAKFRKRFIR